VVNSVEAALEKAKQTGDEEIFIIGGAEIFRQSLGYANRIYLTVIHHSFEGDVFFPEIDRTQWKETTRIQGPVDEKNKYPHDYITLDKID
jgi:dihydrofolate reductase